MKYTYKAYNEAGEVVSGAMEGLNEQDVIEKLGVKDLLVVGLKAVAAKAPKAKQAKARVPLAILTGFTRQLATMLRAGLPLLRCIEGMNRQLAHKGLRVLLTDLARAIEGGVSLSEALGRHPRVFSSMYVAMVRAGENGGILPEVLARVASYLEMNMRLRQRIRSAMMYPLIVSGMGVIICLFMITMIIPVFVEIFKEFERELPLPTLILINTSNWLRGNLLLAAVVAAAIGYLGYRGLRTPLGTQLWHRLKLRLPVVGPLAGKIAFARFARTIASLLNSGVPMLKTLEISACAVGNVGVEAAVLRVGTLIEKGATMYEAMDHQKLFPAMMLEMVAAGEQTGAVDEMLNQVADYYDREIDATLAGLTSLLEPLLILFLGIVVGSIVVAMFLPIFRMADAVQF